MEVQRKHIYYGIILDFALKHKKKKHIFMYLSFIQSFNIYT